MPPAMVIPQDVEVRGKVTCRVAVIDPDDPAGPAPVLDLAAKVAELESRIAALEAQ